MIKKGKKGFTLAELLICIAIISVIAAMGMVVSKKGVERAYDFYVYNSYKSISSAIGEAITNGCSLDTLLSSPENLETFYNNIITAFNLTSDPTIQNNTITFSTTQNVTYFITQIQQESLLLINIYIPGPNKARQLVFLFDPTLPEYGLIPASQGGLVVVDRIDLLPFTINDDTTGKIANVLNENETTFSVKFLDESNKSRQKYSYKDAFCELYDGQNLYKNEDISFEIICNNTNKKKGALKVLDPKKVF